MRFNFSLIRYSYQLLYVQTTLQDKLISPVRLLPVVSSQKQLRFKSTSLSSNVLVSFLRRFIRKKKRITLRSLRTFSPLLKQLHVSNKLFNFFKKYRTSFTLSFVNLLRRSRLTSSGSVFPFRYVSSLFYPLRLLNLCSFVQIVPNVRLERKYTHNIMLQLYTSFLFLYPSSFNDEVNISTFLRFFFSKYIISSSIFNKCSLLNRFLFNSFFFNTSLKRRKKRLRSRNIIRKKLAFYKQSKLFLCSVLGQRAQLRLRFKKKTNTVRKVRIRLLRARNRRLRTLKSVLKNKKLKLFRSYRWYSVFSGSRLMRSNFNIGAMHTFVSNLGRFIYRSSLLNVKRTSYFSPISLKLNNKNTVSSSSLFSFYKKRRLFQLRRFLRRIRFLNKNTYNLYLKGTGSNIYSTFLRNDRVLYSMWSGLFGFKKRLKYRKGAGHKVSHFFHRYISVLYKQKRIYKLNLIINGFSKFLSLCIDALGRQLSYSANYYLNTEKYPHRLASMIKRIPSYYSNKLKKKWSSSFLRSFTSSFISSNLTVSLNSSDLNSLVPELTVGDLKMLTDVISNDNIHRSSTLLRLIRSRRYRTVPQLLDSFSTERSFLVNKLIGIFMNRYNIVSKKDFYKAVSSLNKYKSVIFNSSHADKLDFISAYSIIYLLQVLKQNEASFNKMVSYSFLLKRRFGIYLRKIRRLKRKSRRIRRKKRKALLFLRNKNFSKRKLKHKPFVKRKRKHFVSTFKSFIGKKASSLFLLKGRQIRLDTLFNLFSHRLLRSKNFISFCTKYLSMSSILSVESSFKSVLFKLFILFVRRTYNLHSFTLRTHQINKLYSALLSKPSAKLKFSSSIRTRSFSKKKKRSFSRFRPSFKSTKKLLISNYIQNSLSSLMGSSFTALDLKLARQSKKLRFRVRRLFKSRKRLLFVKRFPRKRMRKIKSRVIVRKRPRGFFFYKKNGKRRRFSKICRLIRTRMRNFTQLIYSVGYVKYRASLSHGGCAARKRYYDKRYI